VFGSKKYFQNQSISKNYGIFEVSKKKGATLFFLKLRNKEASLWSSSCWLYKLLVGGHGETDMQQQGEKYLILILLVDLCHSSILDELTRTVDCSLAEAARRGDGELGREHGDA
jgi:hypothetical protein